MYVSPDLVPVKHASAANLIINQGLVVVKAPSSYPYREMLSENQMKQSSIRLLLGWSVTELYSRGVAQDKQGLSPVGKRSIWPT